MSIFVADPSERDRMMERLSLDGGQMYFAAIHLVGRLPWYIASFLVRDEAGAELYQDVLLSQYQRLESQLAGGDASERVVGLTVVEPPSLEESGTWRLRRVRRVWRCAREDDSTYVSLEDEDGACCDSDFSDESEQPPRKVKLLAEF